MSLTNLHDIREYYNPFRVLPDPIPFNNGYHYDLNNRCILGFRENQFDQLIWIGAVYYCSDKRWRNAGTIQWENGHYVTVQSGALTEDPEYWTDDIIAPYDLSHLHRLNRRKYEPTRIICY